MNTKPDTPHSLAALEDDPILNQPSSIQLVIPSKDITSHPIEYPPHSPYAAINNDFQYRNTPKVPFESPDLKSDVPFHQTLTINPNETKSDTLSTLQPSEFTIEENAQPVRKKRSGALSLDLTQSGSSESRLKRIIDLTRHEVPAVKEDKVDGQGNMTPKSGPSKLGATLRRIMESNKKMRLEEGEAIKEEGNEQDEAGGTGKRWRKVIFMMQALSKLKKSQKDTKELELTRKQLELLYDFGVNQEQKPRVVLQKQTSKPGPPQILKHQTASLLTPMSARGNQGPIFRTPLVLMRRFYDHIRGNKNRIMSETAAKNRSRKRRENKKCGFIEQLKVPITPSAKFRLVWDILLMVLVVIDMIILPLQISFSIFGSAEEYQYSTDSIFILDILLTFHTSFYQNGDLITNHKAIAKHYAKTWLCIDFLSAFPFHAIDNIQIPDDPATSPSKPSFLKLFRILRLIKVIRAFRLFKLSKIFWKFKVFFGYSQAHSFFQLLKLAIIVILISHWLACIWHLVAVFELEFTNNETWLSRRELLDADASVRYINSLYWAVTTMLTVGYGDITPVSVPELWCAVFAMFSACGVFAYSINTIGTIVNNLSETRSKVSWKIYAINKFMQKKNMGKAIQDRVRGYMEHLLEEENNRKHDQEEFLSLMPEHLKTDILMDLNGKLLTENVIFNSNFSLRFLKDLATKLQERSLGPGESIYTENDRTQDNCFFIVTKGKVQLFFQKTNQSLKTLTAGEYFGEVAFFSDKKRAISARSANYSQVFYLEKKTFLETLTNYEREKESFCQIKDQVNFYEDYNALKVKCFACERLNHFAQNCPQLHYIPDSQYIINVVRQEDLKFRTGFIRKNRKSYHALMDKVQIGEGTDKFREDTFILQPPGALSRNSSLTYRQELRRKWSHAENSMNDENNSSEGGEEHEDVKGEGGDFLPQIQEDVLEDYSMGAIRSQRSKTIRFKDGNQGDQSKSMIKKKKEGEMAMEKVKIFSRYFVHNNVDNVIGRINRMNEVKRAMPVSKIKAQSKERRRSTTDSLKLDNVLKKSQKPGQGMSSLSIFPSLFKKERLSQDSIKTS